MDHQVEGDRRLAEGRGAPELSWKGKRHHRAGGKPAWALQADDGQTWARGDKEDMTPEVLCVCCNEPGPLSGEGDGQT
jgi:hypothetical protein